MAACASTGGAHRGNGILISIRDLSKSYTGGGRCQVVLDRLSIDIGPGELTVLLGRSGSGKSTLLNLIAGLDTADAGSIRIAGTEVSALDEPARTLFRRRHIGFVFQAYNLIPTLDVEENLLLPLRMAAGRRADPRPARELLEALGIGDKAHSFPDRLSGGEQQRVAIARALVHDPLLVLADEPTGNLDLETGRQVLDLLDRLVRERGKTLVMATHGTEVIGMADRVLRLAQGRLQEQEPAA